MIPKVINYVWLGRGEKSELIRNCIESWKKYLPEYEIVEWNEDNFNLNCCAYVKEAYEAKKYAFASDYMRLYILYHYGGIYMDTDVEVKRNLDCFLDLKAFSGFESEETVPTGIMAAEKGLDIFAKLLSYYDDRHFLQENGEMDTTTNVVIISDMFQKKGLVLNNKKQTIEEFTFFPNDYFCPKNVKTLKMKITSNTYTIHHFNGSWHSKRKRLRRVIMAYVRRVLGAKLTKRLEYIQDSIRYRKK